jgi:hypothetical protein
VNLDSLTNRGEYLSAHYLAEVLPTSLRGGVLKQWADEEHHSKETPRTRIRALRRTYNKLKSELGELDAASATHPGKASSATPQSPHRAGIRRPDPGDPQTATSDRGASRRGTRHPSGAR